MDRQIKSGQFPVALQPMLKRHKKVDLFGIWLDHNQDWDAVVCHVERQTETKNLSRKQWVAVQAKVLKGQMDETKYEDLIRRRTEQGLYYDDDDFPNDPLDRGSQNIYCAPKIGSVLGIIRWQCRSVGSRICVDMNL